MRRAWKDFIRSRPRASPEEIYRHAGELIFRFELTGPILPYHRGGKVRRRDDEVLRAPRAKAVSVHGRSHPHAPVAPARASVS
ncbi:DUF2380 domain-containing protein [Archangium minus]|uniref:DUF2380 domain-containing protein n=1 Tax=Archangium minus TaxID=83450 RepID=A0ABY9X8L1_9BACT|nr:DUF2380 domain-containing protein [Archangium minus]